MSSDNRKFKIKIRVPKKDDKDKTDDKEVKFDVDYDLFEKGGDIDQVIGDDKNGKYKLTGKAQKGWFGDSIKDLKVVADEGNGEDVSKDHRLSAEQWRYKGPIAVGALLLLVVMIFVWWWMSSSKESKEEEGL